MRVWTKWYRMVPAQPQKMLRNEAGRKETRREVRGPGILYRRSTCESSPTGLKTLPGVYFLLRPIHSFPALAVDIFPGWKIQLQLKVTPDGEFISLTCETANAGLQGKPVEISASMLANKHLLGLFDALAGLTVCTNQMTRPAVG